MNQNINRWLYSEWRNRKIDEKLVALASRAGRNHMRLALADDQPYGLITIGDINSIDKSGILWYLRGAEIERRPGLMSACVRLAIKQAFENLGLHSISASTQAGNRASERLLKAVGFRPAGTLREAFLVNNEFVDRRLFDLLPSDF
jgi:ribosomal-protein-alanine N-acetyltransferase